MADNNFDIKAFLNDPAAKANKAEAIKYLQRKGIIDENGIVIQKKPSFESGFSEGLKAPFTLAKDVISGTYKSVTEESPERMASAIQRGAETMQKPGIASKIKGAAQSALGSAGAVAGAVMSPITSAVGSVMERSGIGEAVGKAVAPFAEKLSENKAFQEFAISHPNAERDIQDATDILMLASTNLAKQPINLKSTASEVSSLGKKAVSAAKNAPESIKSAAQSRYSKSISSDWENMAEKYGAQKAVSKATGQAAKKGFSPSENLSKRGIGIDEMRNAQNPSVLDTSEASARFRTVEPKMAEEVLDSVLKEVDMQRPPEPLSAIKQRAISNVDSMQGKSAAAKSELKAAISSKFDDIANSYKEGTVGLAEQNLLKRDQYSVYDRSLTAQANVANQAQKQIGRAFKESVEEGVKGTTAEANVKAINEYIGNMHSTAEFLEALNGKKVVQSLPSKIVEGALKVAGASAGSSLGGVGGGVGGYYGAKALFDLLESMPNPVRQSVLRTMSATQPQSVVDAAAWVRSQGLERAGRAALPSPSYIPMGPKSPAKSTSKVTSSYEEIGGTTLKKSFPAKNPKNIEGIVKKNVVPKTVEQKLIDEAKKYKSADEFAEYQFKKKPEYGMGHRPTFEGMPPSHNLLEGDQLPRDVYEKPDFSIGNGAIRSGEKSANESWNALKKIRGNPEAEVTIYRATRKNELNPGDWVTFSKNYAKDSIEGDLEKVFKFKVKAKDVIFAGDDVNEFGYYPKSKFVDIWNKAHKTK